MATRKFQRITSPKGTASYPRLNEPDTKFNPDGTYSVNLELDVSGQTTEFLEQITKIYEDAYGKECQARSSNKLKKASMPWTEQDGKVTVKAKLNAKGKAADGRTWDQRPALFDSKGNPIPQDSAKIGSGSTMRMSVEVAPYYTAMVGFGVSLRLRAVQIITLVQYSGGGFKGAGFETEEGYETNAEAADCSGNEVPF